MNCPTEHGIVANVKDLDQFLHPSFIPTWTYTPWLATVILNLLIPLVVAVKQLRNGMTLCSPVVDIN